MVYSGPRRGQKSKYTSVRLTGLFKTKKRGLCVGQIQEKTIPALIDKIKEAMKAKKGLTIFLWVNDQKDEENQPYFTVSIDVAKDREERSPSKPIEDDPFADAQPDDDEVPF